MNQNEITFQSGSQKKVSTKGLEACNFIKKRLQHRCFPGNIAKFLRTPNFEEHMRMIASIIGNNLSGPYEGKRHDSTMLHKSGLQTNVQRSDFSNSADERMFRRGVRKGCYTSTSTTTGVNTNVQPQVLDIKINAITYLKKNQCDSEQE